MEKAKPLHLVRVKIAQQQVKVDKRLVEVLLQRVQPAERGNIAMKGRRLRQAAPVAASRRGALVARYTTRIAAIVSLRIRHAIHILHRSAPIAAILMMVIM